jgi:hypothetical protein
MHYNIIATLSGCRTTQAERSAPSIQMGSLRNVNQFMTIAWLPPYHPQLARVPSTSAQYIHCCSTVPCFLCSHLTARTLLCYLPGLQFFNLPRHSHMPLTCLAHASCVQNTALMRCSSKPICTHLPLMQATVHLCASYCLHYVPCSLTCHACTSQCTNHKPLMHNIINVHASDAGYLTSTALNYCFPASKCCCPVQSTAFKNSA